jgi:hypothetical protein
MCLTDSQLDKIQTGINKVVNRIKNKEIPSIPNIKDVPLNGIQSNFCTI